MFRAASSTRMLPLRQQWAKTIISPTPSTPVRRSASMINRTNAKSVLRGWDVEIVLHDEPISEEDVALETGLASGQVTFNHLKAIQSAGGDSLVKFLRAQGLMKSDASDPTQGFKKLRGEQARLAARSG